MRIMRTTRKIKTMQKMITAVLAAITVLVTAAPITAEAAVWKQDSVGWWYETDDGGYVKNGWRWINGCWYYFTASGYMATGWEKIGGTWYYLGTEGAMSTGWEQIDGSWYYFDGSGAMATDWKQINGSWYYFGADGAMKTGWQQTGGSWYYLKESGAMVTDWWYRVDQKSYEFNGSGKWTGKTWVIDQDAYDEEVWVVDQEAYDNTERVGSEYYCIKCGASLPAHQVEVPYAPGTYSWALDDEADVHLESCNSRYGVRSVYETVHHDEVGHYETVHHDATGHYEYEWQ